MKLTVIGSTSRTGTEMLADGVRRGHRITAFTRRPHALRDPRALAAVIHGDGRDVDAIAQAVSTADAVIAILGPASRRGPHQSAQVATVVCEVMNRLHVQRLIVTSAYPIVGDRPRVPIAVLRRIFAAAYADAAAMERTVQASGLDWTIARLNRLTDGPAQDGTRVVSELLSKPTALTRAAAAAALLDIAESGTYITTAVNLAGP